jgi:hypothetical protein
MLFENVFLSIPKKKNLKDVAYNLFPAHCAGLIVRYSVPHLVEIF